MNSYTQRQNSLYLFMIIFVAVLLGVINGPLINFIQNMGYQIAQPDMVRDYLLGTAYAVFLFFGILFWPVPNHHKQHLMRLWLVRCLITLGFMLFYEGHYGLDSFGYYQDSTANIFPASVEFGNNTAIVGYITWWINHNLMIFDSFHGIKVVFSFIGFLGCYLFYRGCTMYLKKDETKLLYFFNLFPSILFWSSILGKDPINFFAVCLYSFGVLGWISLRRFYFIVPILAGILIAVTIRPWTGLILVAPLVLLNIFKLKSASGKIVSIGILVGAFLFTSDFLTKRFAVSDSEHLVTATNSISHSWSYGGSAQKVPEFKNAWQMLQFAPIGAFTALFRPLPGEVNNPFGALAGIENFCLLFLFIRGVKRTKLKLFFQDPAMVWAFSLILFWSFVYGFVSYQNLGSAVRFKLQVLPILVGAILFLNYHRKYRDVRPSGVRQ